MNFTLVRHRRTGAQARRHGGWGAGSWARQPPECLNAGCTEELVAGLGVSAAVLS